jgi:hypothetical protein
METMKFHTHMARIKNAYDCCDQLLPVGTFATQPHRIHKATAGRRILRAAYQHWSMKEIHRDPMTTTTMKVDNATKEQTINKRSSRKNTPQLIENAGSG